jgi:hypothetical protein
MSIYKRKITPLLFSLIAHFENRPECLSENDEFTCCIEKALPKLNPVTFTDESVPLDFSSQTERYRITLTIERKDWM